jgi:hypothetical protein
MSDTNGIGTILGHGAKDTSAADVTPAANCAGYESTLYAVAFGSLDSTLTYQLQDSDDGTNWANVSSTVVNGTPGQNAILTGATNTPGTMLVLHSSVRRYHRLLPAAGSGSNYGAVVVLQLGKDQDLSTGVTLTVGQ